MPKIKVISQTVHTGEPGQTEGQTDGRTLPNILSPCYAVDNDHHLSIRAIYFPSENAHRLQHDFHEFCFELNIIMISRNLKDATRQCPMPINTDQNCAIDPNADPKG